MGQTEQELRQELEEKLRFETFIAELSARFVNVAPDTVDAEIEQGLAELLVFFKCERCGLLRVGPEDQAVYLTHAAYLDGVPRLSKDLNLARLVPLAYDTLVRKAQVWTFESVSDLPSDADLERRAYAQLGTKSALNIPLVSGGKVRHLIALNRMSAEGAWPRDYVPRLRLVGQIFESALDRAQMETSLRASEEMQALAAEAAGVGLWSLDLQTRVFWATEKAHSLFLFDPAVPLTWAIFLEAVHPEDRPGVEARVAKTLETGAEIDTEYRILRPDGQLRWLHSRGRLHRRVPDGAPLLTGVTQDVTERKRLEEQISASARDWRATFDSLIEPTWILGPDFTIRLGNAAASSFLGLSPEAMVGRPSHHLDGCPQTADKCPLVRAFQTGRHQEGEMWDPQREAWQFISVDPILDEGGAVVGAVHRIRDITDYRQSQTELHVLREELFRVARATTMGAMAAAIAHELNQPLTAILSNAEAAQRLLGRSPVDLAEIREILSDIAADDRRAGAVIQGLRGFLKKGEPRLETLSPRELVQGVHGLLRSNALLEEIAIEVDVGPHLPALRGDRVQLQQVLLNLMTNGLEAMASSTGPERRLSVRGIHSGDGRVRITVADAGLGIPAERLERIFEPFFTSRDAGMGMGLPIARAIVESHGGRLWAENNPGGGATFTVELPAAEEGEP